MPPTFVNPQNYPIMIKIPTGGFVSLRPGYAVEGECFSPLAERRVLALVDPADVVGRVVYEAPVASAPVLVQAAPSPEVPTQVASYPVPPPTLPPRPREMDLKETGQTVTIPEVDVLRNTNREGLSKLCRVVGIKDEGSRNTLLARLTPLAGKTVSKSR